MHQALLGEVLPAHPKPLVDELLSSWIVRLAAANGRKLHVFCALMWPGRQIWNRDIDKLGGDAVIASLADRTATPAARVSATTLAHYAGRLYEAHNPRGNTRWILPTGVYHRTRRRFGVQYCSSCLDDAPEPYFRRSWRLACSTVCTRHALRLRDRCPGCARPIMFHRGDLGVRSRVKPAPMTRCSACRTDYRSCGTEGAPAATPAECAAQLVIERAIASGWVDVPGAGPVYSHLFFDGLRQLLRVMATGQQSEAFRNTASRRYGCARFNVLFPQPGGREVERLDVTTRRHLVSLASAMLSDWPRGFVAVSEASRTWSASLLRDCEPAPFWYWRVVREHLYRAEESASGRPRPPIAQLRRTALRPSVR